ncbi:hypothetical protein SELR_23580 [Selenomonas ruminantium subsp. lactilytica TAM6421]|uniref:Methyltransferase FkbM domain-containing protein n=1 Tax=Selenomonas ruminantium subsp. lactilytica (strain NBRC 103574 / TAM6421) TaxID=927704 RepID=I0GTH9_SELRL|nr:FkbM family methyltransferase [Selenomonas ruminantium]BAL84066.1 hypothetical protein SELR_23580 [Selenomonas ruminantium subsp. lactilytica TAM6421]
MNYVLFPYERVEKNSRVIIYGMGWLGRMFVDQIEHNHYCELLFSVDKNYQSINSNNIAVRPPISVQETEFDYIVIALLSVTTAESVKVELVNLGVPAEKCVYKYVLLESDREQILQKISSMDYFLRNRVGKMLYGLESFAENECWLRTCQDWEKSWLNEKFQLLKSALTVYKIDNTHNFVRLGKHGDGGYLIVENYPISERKILYAFGVGGDVSFEYEMAEQGYQVYMYDHTVPKLPQEHPSFHYQKRGLIGEHDESRFELSTLTDFMRENEHLQDQDMLLKMDIEGFEVDVFRNLSESVQSKFAQIVLELHGLDEIEKWDALLEALAGLKRTHTLVHLHANNWGSVTYIGNAMITEAMELTFVRTSDWNFSLHERFLLNPMDVRCDSVRPERLAWQ